MRTRKIPLLKAFLFFETLTFIIASLFHFSVLVSGFEHREAGTAEAVIAVVLIVALLISWVKSQWTKRAALLAQSFALLGTLVGIFTIIIGIGPQTIGDIAYHIFIVVVLIWGIFIVRRKRSATD